MVDTERLKAQLKTTPAVTCMKILLMVFNFIFWITGIAVLAIGIWMKVDLFRFLELANLYNIAVPWVLIGVGCLIIIVGTLGCLCTVKGKAFLLYLFAAFLMLVFIVELSAGIALFVFQGQLQKGFSDGLTSAVNSYQDQTTKHKAMDDLQKGLQCCGVDTYLDWYTSPWSNKTNSVPRTCCKKPDSANCVTTPFPGGTTNETIADTIYTEGCSKKVVTFMKKNIGAIGGAAIGFAFLQCFGSLAAICLAKLIYKTTYDEMSSHKPV
ncbi:unnamed protein product [Owenia fusiformis]|uniref:Tetraspanin n=1 Tax=Owenia fusiformis TaxID=6347 RepID=A0A8J1UFT5_OWEFU|nr:unnamed protein product [Owenia fusiformis]